MVIRFAFIRLKHAKPQVQSFKKFYIPKTSSLQYYILTCLLNQLSKYTHKPKF